jgi:hypothetical protein
MTTRGSTTGHTSFPTTDRPTPRRPWRWIALGALLAVAGGAFALWFFLFRDDAPEAVDLGSALEGVTQPAAQPAADTSAPPTAGGGGAAPSAGVGGTWAVDRSVTNAEGVGSFGGFRVNEQLVGIGAATAVGRSRAVEGTLTVEGTTVSAASISVDLTAMTTNDSRRDDAVQRALSTKVARGNWLVRASSPGPPSCSPSPWPSGRPPPTASASTSRPPATSPSGASPGR